MSREQCPNCDSFDVVEVATHDLFQYGAGPSAVTLDAGMVPVFTCRGCDFQWVDYRTEDARRNAIQQHLGPNTCLDCGNREGKHNPTCPTLKGNPDGHSS